MRETKHIKVENRILTLDTIIKIATRLSSEYKSTKKKSHHSSLAFSVKFSDGSIYDSENASIFIDDIIKSKRVQGLELEFHDYNDDKKICVELVHGNYYYRNEIVVAGVDSNWVNGTLNNLQTLIDGAEPQSTWFKKLKNVFFIVFSISFGVVFMALLAFFVRKIASKPFLNPFTLMREDPLIIFYGAFLGFGPASLLLGWFDKLWPKLEIQIGPEHTFLEKNRRNVFFTILTVLVLPIILGFIFS